MRRTIGSYEKYGRIALEDYADPLVSEINLRRLIIQVMYLDRLTKLLILNTYEISLFNVMRC